MKPLNNFFLSEYILPQIVEKMMYNKTSLSSFSINYIKSLVNPAVPMSFEWSDLRVSYITLDHRYNISLIIFSQPQYAQSKYGLIIEDKMSGNEQPRLVYFTLEQSLDVLKDKVLWVICTPGANGRHINYGPMAGLPTPFNFAMSVIALQKIEFKVRAKSLLKNLFSKKPNNSSLEITHKYNSCIISQTAMGKINKVVEQLHNKKVNLGIMLGHRCEDCVIIVDCVFLGPRNIDEGFQFNYEELVENANRLASQYRYPMQFIGYIHSQPDNYLSNIDEISSFEQVDEIKDTSMLGIISCNQGDELVMFEFFQHKVPNTSAALWDYYQTHIEIDDPSDSIIPEEYLQLRK